MQDVKAYLKQCAIIDHHALTHPQQTYPEKLEENFSRELVMNAQHTIETWDGYEPTSLHSIPAIASALGISEFNFKDESTRFGLGSFKALGGAYAVAQIMKGKDPASITVATATDGNHGRSVAWGAKLAGCQCVIFIHAEVSQGRADAMAEYGAKIIRVNGDYDESVRQCAIDSEENGWEIISDTSWEGYTQTPKMVMAGYTMMVREILQQAEQPPTHVIIQAGVGGLAGAITAGFWQELGDKLPKIVITESKHAACLIESARNGEAATVKISEETIMAGLSCGETSEIAWDILGKSASLFVTIEDTLVPSGMRLLASGALGVSIEAGECALPGLISAAGIVNNADLKALAQVDKNSRILVFGCEGATDPEIYNKIISGEIQ